MGAGMDTSASCSTKKPVVTPPALMVFVLRGNTGGGVWGEGGREGGPGAYVLYRRAKPSTHAYVVLVVVIFLVGSNTIYTYLHIHGNVTYLEGRVVDAALEEVEVVGEAGDLVLLEGDGEAPEGFGAGGGPVWLGWGDGMG